MVDRLREFMYTGTYQLDKDGRATRLHHPTSLPMGKTKASYPIELEGPLAFHLKMYEMGRILRYQSLVAVAHLKMAEHMLLKMKIDVGLAKNLVIRTYDSAQRVQDTAEQPNDTFGDDNLKELVVARSGQRRKWKGSNTHARAYPALEVDWELAEEEYKDLLKTQLETKRAAKRARRGQQHQQEVAKMIQLSEGPRHL
ncbi:hypothetical protein J4E91_007623 [Alternaria rosae]|nr:hypothetical protein J4E91_007623 [Alternaria rosae]